MNLTDLMHPGGVLIPGDIGNTVQAHANSLDAIGGLTFAANKIPKATGPSGASLLDFLDEDNMASNSATAIPSQQSVKAYADSVGGPEASAAQLQALTDQKLLATTRRLRTAIAPITPNGYSNWSPDWSAFFTAIWEMAGSYSIYNPSNVIAGSTRFVLFKGGSLTDRTISWGSNYTGDLPTDTVDSQRFILASLWAETTTRIVVSHMYWSEV